MCGIAGVMTSPARTRVDAVASVSAMVDALAHRGPDARGVARCTGTDGADVVFGHTRLAILDLSERGAQPMVSRSGETWITFNGEIFNFRELRRDLEAHGRRFRTNTDTEVILEGYEAWGDQVVSRLRGMFAFALWNVRDRTALVVRDPLGIKPLYLYRSDAGAVFASEIRALLASGLVPRTLAVDVLDEFLAYQTVATPRTLIRDVQLIEPGSMVRLGSDGALLEQRQYWHLLDDVDASAEEATAEAATRRVRELLEESLGLHMVSDVPVGVFLSGGIDSSALVALTRQAGFVPHTFTVVMPGTPHDEARFARSVASRFGAEHTEVALTGSDFRDQIPEALTRVDHPSGDGINTFVVSRAVRAQGIKVALSGLGGDEFFGGYPSFSRLKRLASLEPVWRHAPASARSIAARAVRAVGGRSIGVSKTATLIESDASLPQTFPVLRQLFDRGQRRAILARRVHDAARPDPYVTLLEDAARRRPARGPMSAVSFAEARTYMHDVLLRDTDQMSMAHALEVRVPLLDRALVAYLMGLPDTVKEPGRTPKRLLVEALGDALPSDIVHRPKQGFVLPFNEWMRNELRPLCEHHLGSRGLAGRPFMNGTALADLWSAFLANDAATSWSRPWTLIALNAWIERNGIDV